MMCDGVMVCDAWCVMHGVMVCDGVMVCEAWCVMLTLQNCPGLEQLAVNTRLLEMSVQSLVACTPCTLHAATSQKAASRCTNKL